MRSNSPFFSFRNVDWITFSIYISLIAIGWLMIYAVGYGEDGYSGNFETFLGTPAGKQLIWIGISILVLLATYIIDDKFWRTFAYLIYAVSILLLVAVLFFGVTVKGATSWFSFGGFTLQPSELAKFSTCLAVSAYLGSYNMDLKNTKAILTAFGLLILPAILILMQPDAGSALVFLSFLLVLYRAGLSINFYVIAIAVSILLLLGLVFPPWQVILGLITLFLIVYVFSFDGRRGYWLAGFAVIATIFGYAISNGFFQQVLIIGFILFLIISGFHWFRKKQRIVILLVFSLLIGGVIVHLSNYVFNNFLGSHQQERINVWLRPDLCDPRGSLYNVLQSKMAIGSGGLEGKGFLKGTMTKLNYVPEQATDFIFCTIGEEQGFIGSFGIIALFLLLLMRLTILAERQQTNFSRFFAYGVAGIFFVHLVVNIGMTMGIMPVVGIPLPFISRGGSSLLGFTLMIGVLLKLDSKRFRR